MGTPGDIPYGALDAAAAITRFRDRWAEVYRDLLPVATIGLVRPDPLAGPAERRAESLAEFRGIYEALQQTHLPFDVVPQAGLAEMAGTGGLDRYPVLVLPDLSLAADAAGVLRGSSLLLTGASGFDTDGGAALGSAPAERITATVNGRQDLMSTYAAAPGQQGGRRFHGPVVPVHGSLHTVVAHPDAVPGLEILGPAPFGPPEKAYGNVPDGRPATLERRVGAGTVAAAPWTIGRSYHDLGLTTLRDVLVDLVSRLHADRPLPVSAELPEQVELTVQRGPAGTVVHLLNLSGARRSGFGPPVPVRGGSLRITGATADATVRSLLHDAPCPTRWDGTALVADLPEIELFDVVVIAEPTSPPTDGAP
jgi:hypothetical protein